MESMLGGSMSNSFKVSVNTSATNWLEDSSYAVISAAGLK